MRVIIAPVLEVVISLFIFAVGVLAANEGHWWGWLIMIVLGITIYLQFSLAQMMVVDRPKELDEDGV